ncbi:Transcriptional regulator [Penicillium sp. IBT 35674x]|nr:Transcriptional regulator [Penicillium sp. IBT 35674x]
MGPKYKLSDSESESEPDVSTTPSDKQLEKGLRDEVAGIFKSGNMEELTVKRVRLAAEKKLGLAEGYFKTTGDWKARSEQIIKAEVDVQESAQNGEAEPTEKSPSPPPQPKKKAPAKRTKSDSASKPRKRQKTQTPVSEDEAEATVPSGDESEEEGAKPKKRAAAPKKKVSPEPATDEPEVSEVQENSDAVKSSEIAKDDSESEMSVVLDEEPKPKPARKRKSTETAPKKDKKPAPKAKSKDEEDPDQAEIKRLQGWLVKCGIRKMWFRELAPYDTAKAKIKHLKGMLEDAGMTGRYSQEKANKIRDERELKADLEMIQQGAKQWGKGSGDEGEEEEGPPRRRAAARGRQALAFLESDGEESD